MSVNAADKTHSASAVPLLVIKIGSENLDVHVYCDDMFSTCARLDRLDTFHSHMRA